MSVLDDLYDTVGGNGTLEKAIGSFYQRVLEDESLKPFFRSTDMPHLRSGQSMFVSMLVGGKAVYTGKDIRIAHAQARAEGLTAEHLEAFLNHFRDALNDAGVHPDKTEKIVRLLEAQRAAVLNQ